jgi:regulator of replication initiation timing
LNPGIEVVSMNSVQLLIAIVSAFGGVGGLGAFLRTRTQNHLDVSTSRKIEAERESIAVDTARELLADMRLEMTRKVEALEREVADLRRTVEQVSREREHETLINAELRTENRVLRERIVALEGRVRSLVTELGHAADRHEDRQDRAERDDDRFNR